MFKINIQLFGGRGSSSGGTRGVCVAVASIGTIVKINPFHERFNEARISGW